MNFLSPWTIAIAAGLTIPPLVALYFLKLKRAVRLVPSTLLWKRAVEDLRVNSPFQRLRSSLLLFLQLLVLILGAIALGKPMLQTAETHKDTLLLLVDQSASMAVIEADGRSRLDAAKEQAKLTVDNMTSEGRAMVIAFCDRATVVSSFDTDKQALKRKIDSIEQTQSTTSLGEAMSLAEAYTESMVIGGQEIGSDISSPGSTSPATVFLFTDGRVEDAPTVALQRFEGGQINVTAVGARTDNVGILAMDARRNYDRPEFLEVAATVQNFGTEPRSLDAVLYVDGRNVDVQTLDLAPAISVTPGPTTAPVDAPIGSEAVAAFDEIEFGGSGVVEVVLRVDDALPADDRAWTIIGEPKSVRVLLVTEGNMFLDDVLATLPIELVKMTPGEYEAADDSKLIDGRRSAFDVVMLDGHSTARLPQGNYFFWGSVPKIEGVSAGEMIDDQVIFNWDETHPVLRHVGVETLFIHQWLHLKLPREAVSIIDGQTSSVMSYLTRDGSQFLLMAFNLIARSDSGEPLMNTPWVSSLDFVVFTQNVVGWLAANLAATGGKSVRPGEPVTLPVPEGAGQVLIHRPDAVVDSVPSAGAATIHYARTRRVGVYSMKPSVSGDDRFAVNLFNPVESHIQPAAAVSLGSTTVTSKAAEVQVNKPAWHYVFLAILFMLLAEWIVYNRRVFV